MVRHDQHEWQSVALEDGQPFLLTHELFTVVMAEKSSRLQAMVNDVLLRSEQSGQLARICRRRLVEDYVYAERALTEGLLSTQARVQRGGGRAAGLQGHQRTVKKGGAGHDVCSSRIVGVHHRLAR